MKDLSKGESEFKLYEKDLNNTSASIRYEDLNLEVYVVSVVDGNEDVKSDIKIFK